jgi:hypothetical protein
MRRLFFCGLAVSLLGLAAAGCKYGGGHVAGVCDCGEAPVQPIMQPYGVNAGPAAAAAPPPAAENGNATRPMPNANENKK